MGKIANTLTVFILAGSLALSGCKNLEERRKDIQGNMPELSREAIAISAGEDRLWSQKEMREYFDYHGLRDMIISEGEMPFFEYDKNSITVFTGPGFMSSGSAEKRTSDYSGNYTGKISRESLEKYIKEKSVH